MKLYWQRRQHCSLEDKMTNVRLSRCGFCSFQICWEKSSINAQKYVVIWICFKLQEHIVKYAQTPYYPETIIMCSNSDDMYLYSVTPFTHSSIQWGPQNMGTSNIVQWCSGRTPVLKGWPEAHWEDPQDENSATQLYAATELGIFQDNGRALCYLSYSHNAMSLLSHHGCAVTLHCPGKLHRLLMAGGSIDIGGWCT